MLTSAQMQKLDSVVSRYGDGTVRILVGRRALLMCALSICAAACSSKITQRADNVLKLQIGMSREQVLALMAEPERREVHGSVEFLIYQTDTAEETGWNITPVGLVDGRVTGWGRVYYEAAKASGLKSNGVLPKG
jgi:hypothetical protein